MPMENKTVKKIRKIPMFWILFLGTLPILGLMLLAQPDRTELNPQQLPWNASFDQAGKLHALGITVPDSTLQDVIDLYGKDVEVKIFSLADESEKSLEAYFPTIYIGTIKAALALRLNATPEAIEQAYSNGKKTNLTSSGAREVELYSHDVTSFLHTKISSVTLVPRKSLDETAISKRFGKHDIKELQTDGLEHWFFYDLGLELILDKEGPEALQYSNVIIQK